MRLIDLDDFVLLGPGSEWLWIMAQFVALAVTGLAIIRQLRAQRSAAVFDQMWTWNHEFDEPSMTRHKLALMIAIQGRDPASGFPNANGEVADYFERVGYLISRGHVNIEDFWSGSREIVAFYWGVMAPYIEQEREGRADPSIYRWFEWLELEMRKIDKRRLGRSRAFDPAIREAAIADRIAVLRVRLDRERVTPADLVEVDERSAGTHGVQPNTTEGSRSSSHARTRLERPRRRPGLGMKSRSGPRGPSCRTTTIRSDGAATSNRLTRSRIPAAIARTTRPGEASRRHQGDPAAVCGLAPPACGNDTRRPSATEASARG